MLSLLLVEDDKMKARLIARIIESYERAEIELRHATSLEAYYADFNERKPDLVISDWSFPLIPRDHETKVAGMFSVACACAHDVPVLVISGHECPETFARFGERASWATDGAWSTAIESWLDRYIPKPVDYAELELRVLAATGGHIATDGSTLEITIVAKPELKATVEHALHLMSSQSRNAQKARMFAHNYGTDGRVFRPITPEQARAYIAAVQGKDEPEEKDE